MYKLFTDVMGDLPLDYVNAHGLEVIPLSVLIDGEDYTLAADPTAPGCIEPGMFYQRLRAGAVAKSAQASAEKDCFHDAALPGGGAGRAVPGVFVGPERHLRERHGGAGHPGARHFRSAG